VHDLIFLFSKFLQADGVATPYRTIDAFLFRRLIKKVAASGTLMEPIGLEIQVPDYLNQGKVDHSL
jgi:hypothetical protein